MSNSQHGDSTPATSEVQIPAAKSLAAKSSGYKFSGEHYFMSYYVDDLYKWCVASKRVSRGVSREDVAIICAVLDMASNLRFDATMFLGKHVDDFEIPVVFRELLIPGKIYVDCGNIAKARDWRHHITDDRIIELAGLLPSDVNYNDFTIACETLFGSFRKEVEYVKFSTHHIAQPISNEIIKNLAFPDDLTWSEGVRYYPAVITAYDPVHCHLSGEEQMMLYLQNTVREWSRK